MYVMRQSFGFERHAAGRSFVLFIFLPRSSIGYSPLFVYRPLSVDSALEVFSTVSTVSVLPSGGSVLSPICVRQPKTRFRAKHKAIIHTHRARVCSLWVTIRISQKQCLVMTKQTEQPMTAFHVIKLQQKIHNVTETGNSMRKL